MYLVVLFAFLFTWIAIEMTAKWTIRMGRRKPGQYDYDVCDYGQRWEIYQLIGRARSMGRINMLTFFFVTPFMSTFVRLQGGKVGKNCCLYPTGGDPVMPELDMVEIGNQVVVCHLNTGGHFNLEKIIVEDRATLCTRSRIQQGVVVEQGAMLLEKSLTLTGEVLDAKSTWLGSPATRFFG